MMSPSSRLASLSTRPQIRSRLKLTQRALIQASSTELQARQLMLSLLLLAIPTIISLGTGTTPLEGNNQRDSFAVYSLAVAVMILLYYVLSFLLQLGTHRSFFGGNPEKQADPSTGRPSTETENEHGIAAILVAMSVVSLGVVAISEPLVQTLEVLVAHTHLSELFIGLILLPLFGSTAEGVIAIGAASRGRMDLAITSTLESSGQLMLFVLPVLVLIGWPLERFLHLSVPLSALGCTGVAVLAVHWITENNQLDWYEGVQLITLYGVILLGCLLL